MSLNKICCGWNHNFTFEFKSLYIPDRLPVFGKVTCLHKLTSPEANLITQSCFLPEHLNVNNQEGFSCLRLWEYGGDEIATVLVLMKPLTVQHRHRGVPENAASSVPVSRQAGPRFGKKKWTFELLWKDLQHSSISKERRSFKKPQSLSLNQVFKICYHRKWSSSLWTVPSLDRPFRAFLPVSSISGVPAISIPSGSCCNELLRAYLQRNIKPTHQRRWTCIGVIAAPSLLAMQGVWLIPTARMRTVQEGRNRKQTLTPVKRGFL